MPETKNTAINVTAGKPAVAGAIYRAARTANLVIPTSAGATLSSDYKCMGYISEDGLKNDMGIDSDKVIAWGGDTVLPFEKSRQDDFKFKMLEVMNEDVLVAVFGSSNVTVTAATSSAPKAIAINVNSDEQTEAVWVFDMIMRGNNPKRIVVPYGKITDMEEIEYKDDDAVGYDVTLTAVADESGNTHYEYMNIGSATGT
jgi:hypothetical protein